MTDPVKYIDIKRILAGSGSKRLNSLPDFITRIIAKIICQDEMNRIMNKFRDKIGNEFLPEVINELKINIEVTGIENLPENGRCFFVANHPFGILDGLILTRIITRKYGSVKAIANEAFLYVPQLRPFIAAVNVFEGSPRDYLQALEEVYQQDVPISHFPSGEVSRRYHGKFQDCDWQKSFITKSVSSQRDVVPIRFEGRNSNLFFFIYIFRNLFGIKANIELILLPSELFRKKGQTIRVIIGKPIPWKTFDKTHSHFEWAQRVKDVVYSMKSCNTKFKVA
ncbi:MAG: 1-acyl-sn-glycerol-3-phosphate acyltransferase [Bacteroidales bacterium]|nr:1-acyl-sn-glycerol-3-phosphate acyltransferase [Bacteroidales bacterium]